MKGFIKDYRKELQSDIWLMPPLYHRVWQYLKYKVNHKENRIPMKDGTFLKVMPGDHLTSVRNIAEDVGWYERGIFKKPNPKTITDILEWLEKQSMIKIERGKGNRQYTLITLSNWDSYQSNEVESNSEETVTGEGSKQSLDINKNDKECIKNDKEDISTTTRDENSDAIVFYQNNIGMIRPQIAEEILSWINDFGDEMVIEALSRSLARNKPNWGYAKSILKSWHNKNIRTIDQAKAEEVEFQNQQKAKRQPYRFNQPKKEIIPDWYGKQKLEEKPQESETEQVDQDELKALLQKHASDGG